MSDIREREKNLSVNKALERSIVGTSHNRKGIDGSFDDTQTHKNLLNANVRIMA